MGGNAITVEARPVFVVGTSRSGTSMLREMLNRQSTLWVVRETHYFDDLRPRLGDRARIPVNAVDRARCEAYFRALAHRAYGQQGDPSQGEIDADELGREARRLGDTPDAFFEAFCRIRARENGKARWGEKTPRHVFRIPDLLDAFPSAQVVCLVRDPRAMVASYRDWKRKAATGESPEEIRDRMRVQKSYNVVLQALLWRSAMQAALGAVERFGPNRVLLQPYEALVSDPEAGLRGLCTWLGVDYEAAMLGVPVVHSSYVESAIEVGVSTTPVERWRSKLSPAEVSVIQACCGRLMNRLGYVREKPGASLPQVVAAWLSVPGAFIRAAIVNRGRIGRMPEYVGRRVLLVLRGTGSAAD
jgi:Sulfotransferase family